MSANALRASLVASPQNFWIVEVTSLPLHTALMSAGSSYEFTAPRRQPGGVATVNDARAKRVAVNSVRESIVVVFYGMERMNRLVCGIALSRATRSV